MFYSVSEWEYYTLHIDLHLIRVLPVPLYVILLRLQQRVDFQRNSCPWLAIDLPPTECPAATIALGSRSVIPNFCVHACVYVQCPVRFEYCS